MIYLLFPAKACKFISIKHGQLTAHNFNKDFSNIFELNQGKRNTFSEYFLKRWKNCSWPSALSMNFTLDVSRNCGQKDHNCNLNNIEKCYVILLVQYSCLSLNRQSSICNVNVNQEKYLALKSFSKGSIASKKRIYTSNMLMYYRKKCSHFNATE